jgi:hypothetical protein
MTRDERRRHSFDLIALLRGLGYRRRGRVFRSPRDGALWASYDPREGRLWLSPLLASRLGRLVRDIDSAV